MYQMLHCNIFQMSIINAIDTNEKSFQIPIKLSIRSFFNTKLLTDIFRAYR